MFRPMGPTTTDPTDHHPELAAEQEFLDFAQMNLVRMRERAIYLKSLGYQGGNVTEGGVDPDIQAAWDADKQRPKDTRVPDDLLTQPYRAPWKLDV